MLGTQPAPCPAARPLARNRPPPSAALNHTTVDQVLLQRTGDPYNHVRDQKDNVVSRGLRVPQNHVYMCGVCDHAYASDDPTGVREASE